MCTSREPSNYEWYIELNHRYNTLHLWRTRLWKFYLTSVFRLNIQVGYLSTWPVSKLGTRRSTRNKPNNILTSSSQATCRPMYPQKQKKWPARTTALLLRSHPRKPPPQNPQAQNHHPWYPPPWNHPPRNPSQSLRRSSRHGWLSPPPSNRYVLPPLHLTATNSSRTTPSTHSSLSTAHVSSPSPPRSQSHL